MNDGLRLIFATASAIAFIIFLNMIQNAKYKKAKIKAENEAYEKELYATNRRTRPETRAGLLTGKGVFLGGWLQVFFWGDNESYLQMDNIQRGIPLKDSSDRHIVTFGPTGSGKNATVQTPALLDYPGSALVIDVKGQLAAITAFHRQTAFKQDILVLNPFNTLGIPSCTYNPLRFLNPSSLTFASDARRLAEGLVEVKSQGDGRYFETAALDLVATLIMWTVCYEDEKNLITVRRLLNLPGGSPDDECSFQGLMKEIANCNREDIAEGANRYTKEDSKEVRDCVQTAVVYLGILRDGAIANVLRGGENEISFADLKRRNQTVYVVIPFDKLHTHARFLRLVVLSALGELINESACPAQPVLFMIDEFPALGKMPLLENAASMMREYGVKMWFVLQNLPQLKDLYGNNWESFLSAAGVTQFFTPSPSDLTTSKYISDCSGKKYIFEESSSQNSSSGPSGDTSGRGTTTHRKEVPILTVQDVNSLTSVQQILFLAGWGKAVRAWRQNYYAPPPATLAKEIDAAFFENSRPLIDPLQPRAPRALWDSWLASGETFFHRKTPAPHGAPEWEKLGFSSPEKAAAIWGPDFTRGPFMPKMGQSPAPPPLPVRKLDL